MRHRLIAHYHYKLNRKNLYNQYTEVMKAFDILLEYMMLMPVDDYWKKKHLPQVLIEWLKGRDTEGWKGVDSIVYNSLWEIMEEHERKSNNKEP
jgi:hypothetical protein